MKLSFSTLGCPRWSWSDVFSAAKDFSIDGVEIRGLSDALYAPSIEEFLPHNIEKTKKEISRLKIEIPVLTSAATLAETEKAQDSFVEACSYVNLASKVNVPYIRVMGTGEPHITQGDFELGAKLYKHLCSYAAEFSVTPLIETNGSLSSSKKMLEFLKLADCENSGVLWDIHHTYRFGDETPEKTVNALGAKIKHVHVKDSIRQADSSIQYKMMGFGDVPVREAVKELYKINYLGFISLEWVKRWNPDLQEPAVVFSHYVSYMKKLFSELK